jgi:asparagine synthetase B (glutamine-hydrolysing)
VRTNGFALYKGEGALQAALAALEKVKRWSVRTLLDAGDGFQEPDAVHRLPSSSSTPVVLAYSLGETADTASLVHGFIVKPRAHPDSEREKKEEEGMVKSPVNGEYSLLEVMADGRFMGTRDILGTRALWALVQGDGSVSVASDHRLLLLLLRPASESGEGQTAVTGGAPLLRLIPRGGRCVEGGGGGMAGDLSTIGAGAMPSAAAATIALAADRARTSKKEQPSFEEAGRELASLIEESVRRRVEGQRRVAVSFSGGLDSSLIAMVASRTTEVVLCSAFTEGSLDEGQSERAAAALGLDLETALIEEEALRHTTVANPPGEGVTGMDRALSCIYSTTSRLASERGARVVLLGQLADELFGGYMKYSIRAREDGPRAALAAMDADVRACADKAFLRDEAACATWAEVRFPYADIEIASLASRLPFDYKIRGEERKAVLRQAAIELGLPEELAKAPKKAAQFSSGVAKLLKRAESG